MDRLSWRVLWVVGLVLGVLMVVGCDSKEGIPDKVGTPVATATEVG